MGLVTAGVVVFGTTAAGTLYLRLRGNVDTVDPTALLDLPGGAAREPDPTDPSAGRPVDILVIGSDDRSGKNGEIGGWEEGKRSDTTLLAHVSADRRRVEVVSIQRDVLVDIPACPVTGGGSTTARRDMFNSAFARAYDAGGDLDSAVACTFLTVQENTGILPDHVVVVDFAGFQGMVDAIGGVPICVPQDIDAEYVDLTLSAGNHRLDGPTALAFARARKGKGLGDGSDTNRIGNQQRLVAAVMDEVLAKNLLTDVPQLVGFLGAATRSLTVDPALKDSMLGLAFTLRSVRPEDVTFVTTPWQQNAQDGNRSDWTPAAYEMWANIAADRPALGGPEPTTPTTGAPPGPTADPTADPTPDPARSPAATTPVTPAPSETRKAGREPFTLDDTTAVCA